METTTVCFANSFWGLEEAGVESLLSHLADSRSTNEKLRLFFKERSLIEEDYSRRLARLARSCALGESEVGTLKTSLDAVTMETMTMADMHAQSADRMKKDLDDAHTTFASSMRDDRKRIQANIEKLLKTKTTQKNDVTKHRDRYETESRKINGYIAQQNLLLGRELDKNNIKLEKVQAILSSSQSDYKKAVKLLLETTDKWDHDWSNACDRFQDLEEERIERIKTSLWSYANMVSQTCVSDDESCEKIRVSLENCDVHKDIRRIIDIKGTGNEIPSAPAFYDFRSSTRDEERPTFRVARHARSLGIAVAGRPSSSISNNDSHHDSTTNLREHSTGTIYQQKESPRSSINTYPLDGITQLCRSDSVATVTSVATSVAASHLTSSSMYSSIPGSHQHTPATSISSPINHPQIDPPMQIRRKSFMERAEMNWPSRRSPSPTKAHAMKSIKPQRTGGSMFDALKPARSRSRADFRVNSDVVQEPIPPEQDFRMAKMLNIGQNILPIMPRGPERGHESQVLQDPIAEALAKLKIGSREQSNGDSNHINATRTAAQDGPISSRTSTRRSVSVSPTHQPNERTMRLSTSQVESRHPLRSRDTAEGNPDRSGHTGEDMADSIDQQSGALYNDPVLNNTRNFELPGQRINGVECQTTSDRRSSRPRSQYAPGDLRRSPSPLAVVDSGVRNPLSVNKAQRLSERSSLPRQSISTDALYATHNNRSPNGLMCAKMDSRDENGPNSLNTQANTSPSRLDSYSNTPKARMSDTTGQASDRAKSDRSAPRSSSPRPSFGDTRYDPTRGRDGHANDDHKMMNGKIRSRSRSSAEMGTSRRTFTADGKEILRIVEALYDYQAAIPEEIGFCAGDHVAVVEMRQDGWWLGEVIDIKHSRRGLVPSNFFRSLA